MASTRIFGFVSGMFLWGVLVGFVSAVVLMVCGVAGLLFWIDGAERKYREECDPNG